jgi:hypothetical protein
MTRQAWKGLVAIGPKAGIFHEGGFNGRQRDPSWGSGHGKAPMFSSITINLLPVIANGYVFGTTNP